MSSIDPVLLLHHGRDRGILLMSSRRSIDTVAVTWEISREEQHALVDNKNRMVAVLLFGSAASIPVVLRTKD